MLIRFFGGEQRLSFDVKDKSRIFSVFARLDVPFRDVKIIEDSFSLLIPFYRLKTIENRLLCEGIECKREELLGFPSLLKRYRKRVGIPIGLCLAILMIWMSGRVIWCVNIKGNSTVSDEVIIETLESLGCGVGDTYEDIDFDILHNRFLMECKDISWIAVNMNGTHANVEVRETLREEKEEKDGFYNIIATEAGQIEEIAARSGKPVVERFDTVLEGELLISGAISYKQDTMSRFESAKGSVFAKVNRSFFVEVPFEQVIREPTGNKITEKALRFFNFDINLFGNSRIPYRFCDTITMYKQVYLFDTVALPLYIKESVFSEYREKQVTFSEEEAEELALSLYREKLLSVLGDDTIISKSVTKSVNNGVFTISCELYCLADIAKRVPLEITKNNENIKEETEKDGTENS